MLTNNTGASNPINFEYSTGSGNTLTNIGLLLFIVTETSFPVNVSTYGFDNQVYATDLANIDAAGPSGAYSTGFNPKCMFGLRRLTSNNAAYL